MSPSDPRLEPPCGDCTSTFGKAFDLVSEPGVMSDP